MTHPTTPVSRARAAAPAAAVDPATMSLFEQEMRDQVAAARDAVAEAARRNDPLLLQAAEAHLESLVDLARRNGVAVDGEDLGTPAV